MATPRLDDANIEYSFPPEEALAAKILDPLKILWLQTKYSQIWKLRATVPASEGPETDRSFFLKIAELDGKLNFIQELFNDHKEAITKFNESKQAGKQVDGGQGNDTMVQIASSAASRVHSG